MRVLQLAMALLFIVRAVARPDLESILSAGLFTLLLVPSAIAPTRYLPWISAAERNHPAFGYAVVLVVIGGSGFIVLRFFLDRTPSALVAAALALTVATTSAILRRRHRT